MSEARRVRPDTAAVLEVEGVRKSFGGLVALDGVDLDVRKGEIVGLIGPNGAGKSTLFNCIMGVHRTDAGRIRIRGDDITDEYTSQIVRSGVSRTFQMARVFPELTVRENVLVNQPHEDESLVRTVVSGTDEATARRAEELIDFVDLDHLVDEPAGDLSTGQKKLLNIASTLLRDPDVILLDEPTAGVNPALVDDITDNVLELNEEGRTFVVIEHDMDVVRKVSDYVYALANGTNLTSGPPEAVLSDDAVLESYFGE